MYLVAKILYDSTSEQSKPVLSPSYFAKGDSVVVAFHNTYILANLFADIAAQERVGLLFDPQETRHRGFTATACLVDLGHARHEFRVAGLDAGGELGVGRRVFVCTAA